MHFVTFIVSFVGLHITVEAAELCDDAVLASPVKISTSAGLVTTNSIGNGLAGGTHGDLPITSIVVDMARERNIAYVQMYLHDAISGQPTVRLKVGLRSTDVVASGPPFPVQSPCVDSYRVDDLGGAQTIHCENDNSTGRFLVVQVIDINQGIRLRGMQAFQSTRCLNLAVGKTVYSYPGERASTLKDVVDGVKDWHMPYGIHLLASAGGPWIAVDMRQEETIGSVFIYNYPFKCIIRQFNRRRAQAQLPVNSTGTLWINRTASCEIDCKSLCEQYGCVRLLVTSQPVVCCMFLGESMRSWNTRQLQDIAATSYDTYRECAERTKSGPISNWDISRYLPLYLRVSVRLHNQQPLYTQQLPAATAVCADIDEVLLAGVVSIKCDRPAKGRYISVRGSVGRALSFYEIEVYRHDYPDNLALGNCGRQKYDRPPFLCRAIDGLIPFTSGMNYLTDAPQLTIHLRTVETIALVRLYKNQTVSSEEMVILQNLNISVDRQLCSTTQHVDITVSSPLITIPCVYPATGSEVRIEPIPGALIQMPIHLRLCEVQIYRAAQCSCYERWASDFMSCLPRQQSLNITCMRNCKLKIKNEEDLVLLADCEMCRQTVDVTYSWIINGSIGWHQHPDIDQHGRTLTITPAFLQQGETYNFTLTVQQISCEEFQHNASYSVNVAEPPTAGNCTVQPGEGYVGYTTFTVNCVEFLDVDLPLLYMFYINTSDPQYPAGVLLHTTNASFMPATRLPLGLPADNYTSTIFVVVSDSFGAEVTVSLQVKVLPITSRTQLDATLNEILPVTSPTPLEVTTLNEVTISETKNTTSKVAIYFLLELCSLSSVLSVASAVQYALSMFGVAQYTEQLRQTLKDLLYKLSTIEVTDQGTIFQKVNCLNAITAIPILSSQTQEFALSMYQDLAKELREMARSSGPTDSWAMFLKSCRAILTGSINIARVEWIEDDGSYIFYDDEAEDDEYEITAEQAAITAERTARKVLTKAIMKTLEHVSSVLLAHMVSGQSRLDIAVGSMYLSLKKETVFHLSHEFFSFDVSSGGNAKRSGFGIGGIRIPPLCGKVVSCTPDDSLGIQMFQTPINQYYWHKSARLVSTPVLSLNLFDDVGGSLAVQNLTNPLIIVIPRPHDTQSRTRYLHMKLTQRNGVWKPKDLARFTTDVSCGQKYQITLGLPANFTRISLLLVVKTDTKVFVRDFFGDPQSEANPAHFVVDFSRKILTTLKEPNDPGVTHVVEANGVVRIFGLIQSTTSRCRVFLGLLPTYYDSVRCKEYCKRAESACGFCTKNITWKKAGDAGSENTVDIEMKTFVSECLYWHEKEELWTNQGCKVSPNSTENSIVCECSHMSAFSGSFFVKPNKVDVFDMSLFLTVFRNPIVVAIVTSIWCIYILFMVWARRKDKEDQLKQGVIVLSDNDPDAHYFYLVTVITGWKSGAGTTSTVGICMIGSQGTSARHLLEDPHRLVHEKGSENWFLVATTRVLGDLRTVRVWHSCSGLFPSWYLNQITVRDLLTNEVWHFVCNDWLSPNKGRGSVSRTLYVDTNKGSKRYHFSVMSVQSLRDEHPWLSILSPPVHTTFSRLQRVSCAMAFVMFAMLVSIMFYGRPPAVIEESVQGGIILTWDQFRIAVMSFIISELSGVIIIAIFSNARPRDTGRNTDRIRRFSVVVTKTSWWKKNKAARLHPVEFDVDTNNKDRYDYDLRIGLRRAFPQLPTGTTQDSFLAQKAISSAADNTKDSQGCLPWWFVYIGWSIIATTAAASSYVTVMFSLTYGRVRSIAWAISFFATIFQQDGLIEPTRIVIVAAFVTFIVGARAGPNVPCACTLNKGADAELLDNRGDVPKQQPLRLHHYSVPSRKTIAKASEVMKLDDRLWKILREVGICLLFCTFIGVITNRQRQRLSFVLNKSIVDTFVRVKYTRNITFNEVNTVDDIWMYLRHSLVPSLYDDDTNYIADGTNFVVGPVRIRQLRVRPASCPNALSLSVSNNLCWTPYDKHTEEQATHDKSWNNPVANISQLKPNSPWIYHIAAELETHSISTKHNVYTGAGYVILLTTKTHCKIMLRSLQRLQDRNWIDDRTRVVFIEFTIFNPTTSIFVAVTLAFECVAFGTVEPDSNIASLQLYSLTNFKHSSIILIVAIYTCFLIWYTFHVGNAIWQMRERVAVFLTSMWTYINWLVLTLCYAAVVVFVQRILVIRQTMALFRESKDDKFVSFYPAVFLEFLLNYVLGALLTLLMINVLKLSAYVSKRHVLFTSALSGTGVSIMIIVSLYALTFLLTLVMSIFQFSDSCEGYSSMSPRILRILKLYIYHMSSSGNGCVNDNLLANILFFGAIMFFIAMLWRPLLIVFGIKLLVNTSTTRNVQLQEDIDFVDFLWSRFLLSVGYWRLSDFTAYVEHIQAEKHGLHGRRRSIR